VRRPQGYRQATRHRRNLVAAAPGRGWELRTWPEDEALPGHLLMDLVRSGRCQMRVRGDEFTFSTWSASATRLLGLPAQRVRLHVLQVPAPGSRWEIFFGRMPEKRTPIVMPQLFRDRVALLPDAQVMAGGDIELVLADLEPFLSRVVAPAWSLVVSAGEVALLGLRQPDADQLGALVGLAGEIRDALPAR